MTDVFLVSSKKKKNLCVDFFAYFFKFLFLFDKKYVFFLLFILENKPFWGYSTPFKAYNLET